MEEHHDRKEVTRVPTQAHRPGRQRRHDAGARRSGSRDRRRRRQLELQFVERGYDRHDEYDNEHDPFELVTLRSRQRELVRHVANVARPRLTDAGGRHCVC